MTPDTEKFTNEKSGERMQYKPKCAYYAAMQGNRKKKYLASVRTIYKTTESGIDKNNLASIQKNNWIKLHFRFAF